MNYSAQGINMKYETFERIMDEERIAQGIIEFKKYLRQYDFGSGKWDDREILNSGYVLEKLFHLLTLAQNLNNYGTIKDLIQKLIINVAEQEIVKPEWIKTRIDELKLISYYDD